MLKRGFQFAPGYRLQEFLGRGQFGQVWRATAPGGAATAAKFIDLSDGQGQKEYEGIKRVKQIRHANLMPITAIWLLDGQGNVIEEAPDEAIETLDLSVAEPRGQSAVYGPEVEPSWLVVAMLLGGKSLQQRLRECCQEGMPGIPPKELISYMDESAKGLDFLNSPQHDLGEGPIAIQHSDIKPANIVLIGNSAVVCDFGLARILTRNQVTATSAAGTPAYMAPEAISGKPSCSSDQYSLAVTYYHLRTGTLPVTDGSLWEVLDAHRLGKLKLGLVPEAEQEVLRKATDLKWENRFPSCVEMVDALREALRVEGHTKPGFVPTRSAAVSDGAEADTNVAKGDPTATLDLPPTAPMPSPAVGSPSPAVGSPSPAVGSPSPAVGSPSPVVAKPGSAVAKPDQSLEATAPFVAVEQSTKEEGFLKETLPELEERPAAEREPTTISIAERIRRSPKLVAGIAAGFVVVLLAAAMVFRPDPDSGPDTTGNGRSADNGRDSGPRPVVVELDADALTDEAIGLLDKDESQAIKKFTTAIDLDPGLANVEMLSRSGHTKGSVMRMLQTPDGSTLLSLAGEPAPLAWNLNDLSEPFRKLEGHKKSLDAFTLSPNGERLLTGGRDYDARIWNLQSGQQASSTIELVDVGPVLAAAWHPDGKTVLTVNTDKQLSIWRLGTATLENPGGTIDEGDSIPCREQLESLVFDSAGELLVAQSLGISGSDRDDDNISVFRWNEFIDDREDVPVPVKIDAKGAKKIALLKGDGEPLVVATGDATGTISVYKAADGELIEGGRIDKAHTSHIEALRVVHLPRSDLVVTGSDDGSVHWWKLGSTSEARQRFFPASIGSVDVSADGRWVAAGDDQGSVWLWDTDARDKEAGVIQLSTGDPMPVDSVLIDVNSMWLVAGTDKGIRIWDLRKAKLMALAQPTAPSGEVKTIVTPIVSMIQTPRL